MKKILLLLAISFLLSSCSTTNLVYLNVNEPAPVSVPIFIKRVGIINRSLLSDENKVQNTISNVMSEKGPGLDIEGSKESIRGVKDALMQNNRFAEVRFLDTVNLRSPLEGVFPSPISWDRIAKMCRDNKVDAIFALELFDTDSKISYTTSPTTIKNPLGVSVPAVEHHATMVTTVKTGWRIYDPQSKTILDEFPISQSLTFSGSGLNPVAAAAALLDRKEAVKQTGYKVGQGYATRILPYTIRVSREYYVRGSGNFKSAKFMARTGDWNGAAALWQKETSNPKSKIQARADYNMAISSEINGDLESAIGWSQKAYETAGKRLALNYLNILKDRKVQSDRLKSQNEGK
jgi:hypothetical protein